MLPTTNVFLCGIPLDIGMNIILFFHLAFNFLYIGVTVNNIILMQGEGLLTDWNEETQFGMIALELIGIPIIVLTYLIGVSRRIDVACKIYLGYLFVNFVVDIYFLTYFFVVDDIQCNLAEATQTARIVGAAFMCGFVRIMSYLFVAICITIQVYVIYVVWSYVEDVHLGDGGPPLSSMLTKSRSIFQKERQAVEGGLTGKRNGPYGKIVGTTIWGDNPGSYPSPYGMYGKSSLGGALAEFKYYTNLEGGGAKH